MIRTAILVTVLAAAAVALPESANAQSWPGQTATNHQGTRGPIPLRGDESVSVRCTDPCSRPDNTAILNVSILLFASALDVERAREFGISRADASAAMAGVLDFQSPADGATNRIGAQAFTIGDETAVGLTYTREMDGYDLGIGISTVGERSAAKFGVGFSW